VWSYDESEWQTFEDVVLASSSERAAKRVEKARPYATLDIYVQPMLLKDYITHLLRELDSPDDSFKMIEDWERELHED
jgi:hypothetical protein